MTTRLAFLLIDSALKGAVLLAVAAVIARLLRDRPAAARHAVWTAAICGQLLIPVLGLVLPAWNVPLLSAPWVSEPTASTSVVTPTVEATPAQKSAPISTAAEQSAGQQVAPTNAKAGNDFLGTSFASGLDSLRDPRALMTAIWLLGAVAVLLRLCVGTWRVGGLAKKGERVDDGRWLSLTQRIAKTLGVDRPLTLLRGELAVPVTWGIVYPAVLLPAEADEWPEERRRFVLVHELAHVKRFDALTQLVAQFTLALFWFNPMVWVAAHQMRVEREHACDDYVLRDGTPPSQYASELLEMVRTIGTPAHDAAAPAFAALAMARRSEFEGRMLAILDARLDRQNLNRRATAMTAVLIALIALPLAALRPFETPANAPLKGPTRVATPARSMPSLQASAPTIVKNPVTTTNSYTCDDLSGRTVGTSIHSSISDDGHGSTQVVILSKGHCISAAINGKVSFTDDERSIRSIAPASFASFRERLPNDDRSVSVTRGSGGSLEYVAMRDGRDVAFDANMQSWLASFLPRVLRETGINVEERVARIKAQGGVPAVLAEISQIKSSSAKRAHYDALLASGLTETELDRVMTQVAKDFAGNSGDLSAVVMGLARTKHVGSSRATRAAVATAVANITSSGDKYNALATLAPIADRDMLLSLATAAEGIQSSGDKANFLMTAAAYYLTKNDKELTDAYFHLAATVSSGGDLANVLMSALPYGHANAYATTLQFQTLPHITSSGDRANVLMTMAGQHLIKDAATRDAFMKAAMALAPGDTHNVLGTLLGTNQ